MTYQEIIQAIDSLPIADRGSLFELMRQQQAEITVGKGRDLAHTNDRSLGEVASSSRLKCHFPELTPAEIAQRAEKVKRCRERDEQIRLLMTPEELEQSSIAFEILDESLRTARGLNGSWE